MSHIRQQVREVIRTRVTGLATTGTNVEGMSPHSIAGLPSLRVTTAGERIGPDSFDVEVRELTVLVTAFAAATAAQDIEDVLDAIGVEVETAVLADPRLGGIALDTRITGERRQLGDKADERNGASEMTFVVLYRVAAGVPEVAL